MPTEGRQWIATDSKLEFFASFSCSTDFSYLAPSLLCIVTFLYAGLKMMSLMSFIVDQKCCFHEHQTMIFFCIWLTAVYSQSLTVQEFWAMCHWFMTDDITAVLVSVKLKCPHKVAIGHCPVTGVCDFWPSIIAVGSEIPCLNLWLWFIHVFSRSSFWSATIQVRIIYSWFKVDFSNSNKKTTATHNVNLGWQAEISSAAITLVQKFGLASFTFGLTEWKLELWT